MSDALELSIGGGPDAARTARHAVAERLDHSLSREAVEEVQLVISELVTNAVRHADAGADDRIDVRIIPGRTALRIEVSDSKPDVHPAQRDRRMAERGAGGLGLVVVDTLCPTWGTETLDGRKTVWADYRVATA